MSVCAGWAQRVFSSKQGFVPTHRFVRRGCASHSWSLISYKRARRLSLSLSLSISLSFSLCFILAFYDTPVVALRPRSTTREPAIRRAPGRRGLASVREGRAWFVLSFGGLRGYDTQRVRVFPVRVAKCWHVSPSRLAYRHRGRYFQQKPRLRVLAALALAGQKLAYLTCVVYNNDTYR